MAPILKRELEQLKQQELEALINPQLRTVAHLLLLSPSLLLKLLLNSEL
jgi:hypothetical protein